MTSCIGVAQVAFDSTGFQTFCLTTTDGQGCEAGICKEVYVNNPIGANLDQCAANFSAVTGADTLQVMNPFQYSAVTVIFTDMDGEEY